MPPLVHDSEDESSEELFLDTYGAEQFRDPIAIDDNLEQLDSDDRLALVHARTHLKRKAFEAESQPLSTIMALKAATVDLFDIESTFGNDGAMDKSSTKKRRKTAGEMTESPRKRVKDTGRSWSTKHHIIEGPALNDIASKSKQTPAGMLCNEDAVETLQGARSFGTQAARENVLLPPSSGLSAECGAKDGTATAANSSGDTVRIATDEQQVMVEHALQADPGIYEHESYPVESNVRLTTGDNGEVNHSSNSSSSIPWSAGPISNTQTPSNNSKKRSQSSQSAKSNRSSKSKRRTMSEQHNSRAIDSSQASHDELSMAPPEISSTSRKRSRRESATQSISRSASDDRSTHRVNESASQDDLASPNIPKEQYNVQPSRSRSAAIEYEQIDWSLPPEKAARKQKNKRTKTGGSVNSENSQIDKQADAQLQLEAEVARRAREARDEDSSGLRARASAQNSREVKEHDSEALSSGDSSGVQAAELASHKKGDPNASVAENERSPARTSQAERSIQQHLSQRRTTDLYTSQHITLEASKDKEISVPVLQHAFATPGVPASPTLPQSPQTTSPTTDNVLPGHDARKDAPTHSPSSVADKPDSNPTSSAMLPPSSSARKKKSKRSHTTIFEDHVGLRGRGVADDEAEVEEVHVSLKQQQATRKKRGRPRKVQPSSEDVAEKQEEEVIRGDAKNTSGADMPLEAAVQEVPKKGRGRPKKKQQPDEVAETQAEASQPRSQKNSNQSAAYEDEEDLFAAADAERGSVVAKAIEEPARTPTPSPEKIMDLGVGKENPIHASVSSKDADGGVETIPRTSKERLMHSPIKKSALSKYRVGLSRTQRIQPLLRIMKR